MDTQPNSDSGADFEKKKIGVELKREPPFKVNKNGSIKCEKNAWF